jgi:hypothetical protein
MRTCTVCRAGWHTRRGYVKTLPPIPYEQREMCLGQIVAQGCY